MSETCGRSPTVNQITTGASLMGIPSDRHGNGGGETTVLSNLVKEGSINTLGVSEGD